MREETYLVISNVAQIASSECFSKPVSRVDSPK